jgi:hypothetical protein
MLVSAMLGEKYIKRRKNVRKQKRRKGLFDG